jgi:hypothetical protein
MVALNTTAIVAWWGALLSTTVFLWDIYKYRHAGPKIHFQVNTGMETIHMPMYDGKTVMLAEVINRGDRSTTITNLGFEYFEKRRWFRRIPDKAAVCPMPILQFPLPYVLEPGKRWNGIIEQVPQLEKWASKHLDMLLYHSHTAKPIRRRVIMRKPKA